MVPEHSAASNRPCFQSPIPNPKSQLQPVLPHPRAPFLEVVAERALLPAVSGTPALDSSTATC